MDAPFPRRRAWMRGLSVVAGIGLLAVLFWQWRSDHVVRPGEGEAPLTSESGATDGPALSGSAGHVRADEAAPEKRRILVVDARDETPIEDAQLQVRNAEGMLRDLATDGPGAWMLVEPRREPLTVTATALGYLVREASFPQNAAELRLALAPTTTLTVLVRDEQGQPIAMAQCGGMILEEGRILRSTTRLTDPEGRATIEWEAGRTNSYTLSVSHPGYLAARLEIVVGVVGDQVDVVLQRGAQLGIEGHLGTHWQNTSGWKLRHVASGRSFQVAADQLLEAGGPQWLGPVPLGPSRVELQLSGTVLAARDVDIPAEGWVFVVLAEELGGRRPMEVVVHDEHDHPIPGAVVVPVTVHAGYPQSARADREGRCHVLVSDELQSCRVEAKLHSGSTIQRDATWPATLRVGLRGIAKTELHVEWPAAKAGSVYALELEPRGSALEPARLSGVLGSTTHEVPAGDYAYVLRIEGALVARGQARLEAPRAVVPPLREASPPMRLLRADATGPVRGVLRLSSLLGAKPQAETGHPFVLPVESERLDLPWSDLGWDVYAVKSEGMEWVGATTPSAPYLELRGAFGELAGGGGMARLRVSTSHVDGMKFRHGALFGLDLAWERASAGSPFELATQIDGPTDWMLLAQTEASGRVEHGREFVLLPGRTVEVHLDLPHASARIHLPGPASLGARYMSHGVVSNVPLQPAGEHEWFLPDVPGPLLIWGSAPGETYTAIMPASASVQGRAWMPAMTDLGELRFVDAGGLPITGRIHVVARMAADGEGSATAPSLQHTVFQGRLLEGRLAGRRVFLQLSPSLAFVLATDSRESVWRPTGSSPPAGLTVQVGDVLGGPDIK